MESETESLLDCVGPLYDTLVCPESWNEFLSQLRFSLNCGVAVVTLHDLENQYAAVQFSAGISEESIREWTSSYGRKNPRGPEARRGVMQNAFWFGSDSICKVSARYREDAYVQWRERQNLFHSMLLAVRSGAAITAISVSRPEGAVPFETGAQQLMVRLAPHIQRTLQVHSRNDALGTLVEAGKFALDKFDTAVIAVDQNGRVVLTNRSADAILSSGRALAIRGGTLTARHVADRTRLESLLRSTIETSIGRSQSNGGMMTIHDDDRSEPMSVIATPFRSHRVLVGERPRALIFIVDPGAKPMSRAQLLRDLYGLSPAECRLSELLHEGVDVNAAADRLRVTIATARFMLKRIFRKTGAHRQSHLLQLLSRLPAEQK